MMRPVVFMCTLDSLVFICIFNECFINRPNLSVRWEEMLAAIPVTACVDETGLDGQATSTFLPALSLSL